MQIGQMANHISYLDGVIVEKQTIQLIGENPSEWEFRINGSDDCHLTVSKKCGMDFSWHTGPNKTLKRRRIIKPYKQKK